MRTTHNALARMSRGKFRARSTKGRARTGPESLLLTRILWLISAAESPSERAAVRGGQDGRRPARRHEGRGKKATDGWTLKADLH